MNLTSVPAPSLPSPGRPSAARLGRVLLVSALAAAVIACAPARKADYPAPLFTSAAVDQSPSMVIKKDIDLVRLDGVLGSHAQVELVTQSAADLFGAEMIINNLSVDHALADANWLPGVLQTVNAMRDVEDFSLVAGSGHLVVGGTVDSHDTAEEVANIASDLAGLTLAVSSTIAYPESTVPVDTVAAESISVAENTVEVENIFVAESAVEAENVVVAESTVEAENTVVAESTVEAENIVVAENTVAPENIVAPENTVVAENIVTEPQLVPDDGVAVSFGSLAGVEQQAVVEQQALAVAIEQPVVMPVAAVAVAPDQSLSVPIIEAVDALTEADPVAAPIAQIVPAALPEEVVVVPASANTQPLDSDGDGVVDANDECSSRSGYPVNTRGCQLLDGYLKDVHFYGATDQLTEDAMMSLNKIADIMNSHPISKIAVLSYSRDGAPGETRMQARERAYSVVDYLVGQGIDPARLQAFALAHRQGISEQILIKEVD